MVISNLVRMAMAGRLQTRWNPSSSHGSVAYIIDRGVSVVVPYLFFGNQGHEQLNWSFHNLSSDNGEVYTLIMVKLWRPTEVTGRICSHSPNSLLYAARRQAL